VSNTNTDSMSNYAHCQSEDKVHGIVISWTFFVGMREYGELAKLYTILKENLCSLLNKY